MAPAFPLQTVLNFREQRVETLQLELAQLISAERDLRAQKDQRVAMEKSLLDDLARARTGVLDMNGINQLYQLLRATQRRIEELDRMILEMRPQIEAKREEMIRADQARETLEQIKEHAEARWRSEVARKETMERDDQYIARAFRQARGS